MTLVQRKPFNPATDTVVFLGYTCRLVLNRVVTGHTRIDLIDVKDGCPVTTATKGVPDLPVEPGVVFVKDYSENEGLLEVLTKAGVVKPTGEVTHCGLTVCQLLIPELPMVEPETVDDWTTRKTPGGPTVFSKGWAP